MTTTLTAREGDRYPSRVAIEPTISERLDPVVHPGYDGPLDPELVQAFDDDGFVVLPGLLPPSETAELNNEIDRHAAEQAWLDHPETVVEPGCSEPRSIYALHTRTGPLSALTQDRRLVDIARQLLGDKIYVHQSRAHLEPAFRGRELYWHSDFETWHTEDGMPRPRAVSCSVLLTDHQPGSSPLLTIVGSHKWYVPCVGRIPKSHREESLRCEETGTPDEASLIELTVRGSIAQCLGPAGTVVFFDSNLMHGSSSNITPYPRRSLFVVYNAVSNALEEPFAAPTRRPDHIASRIFDPI